MPTSDEISEEGFGDFRGTWFIGRVRVAEARASVQEEAEIIEWLDMHTSSPEEYEELASAIEKQDIELVAEPLRSTASAAGLTKFVSEDDHATPLGGLEVGVAGLAYALSAVRCLTAASCRWHISDHSWADCPVVLFAAPAWRVELLADLIAAGGCGLAGGRGMLSVFGASIRETHRLAERILSERGRFRKIPGRAGVRRWPRVRAEGQLNLFSEGLSDR